MRHLLHFLSLLLASAALLRPGESRAQSVGAAFSCDGTFYQIRQVGNTSQIFKVNRSSAAYSTDALNIVNGSNDLGVLVNGLAYNSQDGYMYALSTTGTGGSNAYNTISLYKIGQGGIVKVGGPITVNGTALGMVVASGTFDKVGNYYFSSQNTNTGNGAAAANYNVYRLQPTSSTPTAATQLTTTNSGSYTFYDIAYNPSDNNLYGTLNTGSLYKIVLSGGTSTAPTAAVVTQVSTNSNNGSPIGSTFFDVAGNMYGYSNGATGTANSGGFYSIDLTSGTYTLISSIDPASVSDGASCINPGNAIDVTKEVTNVKVVNAYTFDISYAIRVRNTYTATDTYVQVSDLLKGNANNTNSAKNVTFPTASSVTIITKPVVTSDNGATLVANANYTGLSGNGGLLDGTQPLTAGQEALITYTVEVAFANANSVPTAAQNNTAYATSSSSGTNQGYTLTSTDVLVSPNDLIANDASTNSSSYPTLRNGSTGTPAANDTPAATPVTFAPSINGTVFEDVDYGGGAGRSQGASQGIGRSGARVELYTVTLSANNTDVATYSTFTTTAADGSYSFTGLTAGNRYLVRVVSSTVTSSRNAGSATGLVGVQTYRTSVDAANGTVPDPNRVGGEYPARVEAGNGSTTTTITSLLSTTTAAESIANVTLSGTKSPAVDVDFGYNFDTVVNTNDTGQGSLRQFITNANALQNSTTTNGTTTYLIDQDPASTGGPDPAAGVETSIFMIPDGKAHAGLLAYNVTSSPGTASQLQGATNNVGGTVAVITPASLLPAIGGTYGASTSIDGTTQTQNVGDTNSVTLGAGGSGGTVPTVGTGATTLSQVGGPEVQITGSSSLALGLDVASTGANTTLKGLSIYGFGNGRDNDDNAVIRSKAAGLTITQSVIGSAATAFAAPSTLTNADNIRISSVNGGSLTISNNLIGFSNSKGIAIGPGQAGAVITNNEVRSNGQGASYYDGVDIQGNTATVTGNLFINNAGQGVDSYNSNGYNNISGNTITGNGGGTSSNGPAETPGVRVYGAGNTVSNNIIAGNYGAGIMLNSGASTTTISQNSIYNNGNVAAPNGTAATGELGIDLLNSNDNDAMGTSPYVTLNDNGDTDTGANGLLNFPVLTGVSVSSNALVVTGYARPGSTVEFFLAQPNPASVNATGTNFGQGQGYLITRTEGSSDDTNAGTGTYGAGGASTNGFNQGTDNTNLFTFSIPLSSLTTAQVKALQSGSAVLTSTATLSSATSEFSGNLAVSVGDVTVALNGATTLYAGQATGTYTAVFTNEGPQAATTVARVITLPTGATATAAQAPGATIGTNASGNTTLTYPTLSALALNATSTVSFAFTAPSTVSTALTLTATTSADSEGANTAPNQATLTLGTVAAADVTAAVTATASTTTGTITATFGNNGPQTAAGLTPTVQLPANLTNLTVPSNWTYTASTGLLTYNTTGATLASGSTLSVTVTYPLSSAPAAPLTAVASVTTTTDEAGRTANNMAQAVMPTAFDLTTTLNGPASTIAGSPMTLYVTTTNNGPNLAADATQTVTIPSATSLANAIYITNGGTYSYSNGVGTIAFPKLTSVPAGQTVTNSITFPAPSASFAPSATVSSTATEISTTNNTAYLNGASSSTNVTVSSGSSLATENESTTITTPSTVVAPGAVVTYTVTSTNKGGAGATASATVTEKVQLLPGLTASTLKVGGVTATANGSLLQFASAGGTSTYDPATGVLTYYSVTQVPGTSTTYDAITVTTPATVGNDGQLMATATVSTSLNDNVPADNVATVGVRVATVPDVTTSVSGPSSTPAGLPASYVVKFVNNGTTNAYGVTESAQLPAGLSGVSILDASGTTVTGASYSTTTGVVTLPSQSVLAAGTQQQYTLVLAAAPAQTFPVSSAVASTTADGVATNNTATLSTTVTPNADLAVSISGPSVATVGNLVTYTVNTTNNGPSAAANAVVKLTLPSGLTLSSTNGSGPGNAATATTNGDGTTTYTFATISSLATGGSYENYLNFIMPNPSAGLINGTASVSSATADVVASNNTAGITTSISPATTATADLRTSISLAQINGTTNSTNPATVAPGALLTYDVAFRNAAGSTAINVMPSASLPAGLSVSTLKIGNSSGQAVGTQSGNVITFNNAYVSGVTYNVATGLLTFPTIASAPVQTTTNADYYVNFPAPAGASQIDLTSQVSSSTTDSAPASNFSYVLTNISTVYDVVTSLSGPATAQPGATAGYTVTTLNNGPSTATANTTQNVTGLPTNLGVADVKVDGLTGTLASGVITYKNSAGTTVATYTQSSGTLNLADVAALPAGTANEVVHSFTLPMPASGNVALTATTASANESTTTNNTATLTTTPANIAPVAQNVWNRLQSARGNTANAAAANGLPISALNATDSDGSVASYTVVTIPNASTQGTLYYVNSSGGYTAVAANTSLTPTQAANLTFAPVAGTAGDVTFTYTATDNGNGTAANALTSPAANYTIMVAPDQSTTYAATPAKGGSANKYATYDVLAYTIDPNTAAYNNKGLVYGTAGGTTDKGSNSLLQSGAANGLPTSGTNATLAASGSGPAASGNYPANPTNTLPSGVSLDPITGLIYVSDANQLPRVVALTYYQVNVITTDLNGGTNTTVAQFVLGALPLPVELVAFTVQAVQNRDGLLQWTTASELQNDHFVVERSLDGVSFTKIGQVAGQGSKATSTDYTFTDASIGAKVAAGQPVYYRLQQVDTDGTSAYSPTRSVRFAGTVAVAVTLYPNPAAAATSLDLSALPATGSYQVLLLDATGRQVRQATLSGGLVQALDLHDLATGTYSVLVSGSQPDGSALRQVLRLTKE